MVSELGFSSKKEGDTLGLEGSQVPCPEGKRRFQIHGWWFGKKPMFTILEEFLIQVGAMGEESTRFVI